MQWQPTLVVHRLERVGIRIDHRQNGSDSRGALDTRAVTPSAGVDVPEHVKGKVAVRVWHAAEVRAFLHGPCDLDGIVRQVQYRVAVSVGGAHTFRSTFGQPVQKVHRMDFRRASASHKVMHGQGSVLVFDLRSFRMPVRDLAKGRNPRIGRSLHDVMKGQFPRIGRLLQSFGICIDERAQRVGGKRHFRRDVQRQFTEVVGHPT
mmetsp:Transcript_51932/g.155865  ORF Transcript_51932/g.155865 Transcript_51932/m.155865 type:complete len:205 (-) Transcript_51932:119-733(-)